MSWTPPDSGGSSDGCFIITAAYGNPKDPMVQLFREARDEVAMNFKLGRQFMAAYYRHGPKAAAYIAQKDSRRDVARMFLAQAAKVVTFTREKIIDPSPRLRSYFYSYHK